MKADLLVRLEPPVTMVTRVIEQIERLIRDGSLAPGDKLPAERSFGEKLGVSRTVLREALSALAGKGLIQQLRSGGYAVAIAEQGAESKGFADPQSVHDARRLIEIEMAAVAAIRRSEADLQQMEGTIGKMRKALESHSGDAFARAYTEFHTYLSESTQNPVLSTVLETVFGMAVPTWREQAAAESLQRTIRHHEMILRALMRKDATQARIAMKIHLDDLTAAPRSST